MKLTRGAHTTILNTFDENTLASPRIVHTTTSKDYSIGHIRNEMQHLCKEGYLERTNQGIYKLTDKGHIAMENSDLIGSAKFDDLITEG